jgi:hypothetical protein
MNKPQLIDLIAKTTNTLNESVGKSKTANRMVGELSESKYNYNILESNESGDERDKNINVNKVNSQNPKESFWEGGGNIFWNPTGNKEETYEQPPNGRVLSVLGKRPEINLLHELAHAWDNMAGLLADITIKYRGLEVYEWTAVRTENMIRKEMGLPLRTHYGVIKNNGGPEYPNFLDLNCNYLYDKYKH